ncbi:MAG: nucleoside monophosphate kinase [Clostridia bacterium]|jgi:adenylate kinase|nr:nucleoside monophosphate kinase [Clostridia bacterium]MDD4276144.1 nucleoside monophosphate kinase [Clostridia bacterium]
MNIVLLGSPGSGKSFVGGKLENEYGLMHISTGNLLRKNDTLLKAHNIDLSNGDLVSDELVFTLLKEHIKNNPANGYILDGIPRTIEQAIDLEKFFDVDTVLFLNVTDNTVISRLMNRYVCKDCGKLKPADEPAEIKVCNLCGGELVKRTDDNYDIIKHRIEVFKNHNEPLKQYYTVQHKLNTVNANLKPDTVYKKVQKIIGAVKSNDNKNRKGRPVHEVCR